MSTAVVEPAATDPAGPTPKPLTTGKQPAGILIALWLFVTLPFVGADRRGAGDVGLGPATGSTSCCS